METIHTDSAYEALSGKEFTRYKIKMSSDQSTSLQEQGTFVSSNVQQQMNDSDTKVSAVKYFRRFHLFMNLKLLLV